MDEIYRAVGELYLAHVAELKQQRSLFEKELGELRSALASARDEREGLLAEVAAARKERDDALRMLTRRPPQGPA